jgi:Stress responsive A/B Barrel Domain
MQHLTICLLALLLSAACTQPAAPPAPTPENARAAPPPEKILRHVVLFKFKDGTTPEQVREIEQAFAGLKNKMPELIRDFEYGTNNSPEGLNQGLTHCFIVTFATEKDRDAYLPHPEHQAFVEKYAKPFVDKVTVFDYRAQ